MDTYTRYYCYNSGAWELNHYVGHSVDPLLIILK